MADVRRPRIGVNLPFHGPGAPVTVADAARMAEEIGYDSAWMSDHVVMVEGASSPYPFDTEGVMRWDIDHPMPDTLIVLAVAGAVTSRIELGTCVLIAPMRNPVVLAKQVATIDMLTGGRFTLGVGVGWLAAEFAVLGAPFEDRGTRLDEWMTILRDCWTGRPTARRYKHWEMPPGVRCYPTPARNVPILVGGMSKHALRRAGRDADGWMAFQYTEEIDVGKIRGSVVAFNEEAALAGRPPPTRLAMRAPGPIEPLAEQLDELVSAGITEVVVTVDWNDRDAVAESLDLLQRATP